MEILFYGAPPPEIVTPKTEYPTTEEKKPEKRRQVEKKEIKEEVIELIKLPKGDAKLNREIGLILNIRNKKLIDGIIEVARGEKKGIGEKIKEKIGIEKEDNIGKFLEKNIDLLCETAVFEELLLSGKITSNTAKELKEKVFWKITGPIKVEMTKKEKEEIKRIDKEATTGVNQAIDGIKGFVKEKRESPSKNEEELVKSKLEKLRLEKLRAEIENLE